MYRMFNSHLKYLFLVPIALMIAFILFYQYAFSEIQQKISSDKMIEKRVAIDLIASSVNNSIKQNHDWNTYNYQENINAMIEELNSMNTIFAAQFDEQLSIISNKATDSGCKPFDPTEFSEFVDAVKHNERGDLEIPYDNGHHISPMQLSYRWIPDNKSLESRILLVIGTTQDSITKYHTKLIAGIIVQIATTSLINVAFVILLCYLGTIYKSRNGPKWRS